MGVVLFNHSNSDFQVNIGDRIAQLIIEKITETYIQEVDSLNSTARGVGGFGSTGFKVDNTKMEECFLTQKQENQKNNCKTFFMLNSE